MNSDAVKKIGKLQEQIETEYKSRRNYPKKWLKFHQEIPWKEMYNPNEVNKQVKIDLKDDCPFVYTNEGDSYFVSPEMYNSLVAVCRCGRPRSGLHLLKCLQNQQNKFLMKSDNETKKDFCKLPETSNGFVGGQNLSPVYKKWENSMKYVSPLSDTPGGRITATSYNAIFIG